MPWVKDVCTDALCGLAAGSIKGIFGISLFSASEVEEIESLKRLSLSLVSKSRNFTTDPSICEEIAKGSKSALKPVIDNAPSEAVAAGVAVVCEKAFRQRFRDVLMGACLNLAGC